MGKKTKEKHKSRGSEPGRRATCKTVLQSHFCEHAACCTPNNTLQKKPLKKEMLLVFEILGSTFNVAPRLRHASVPKKGEGKSEAVDPGDDDVVELEAEDTEDYSDDATLGGKANARPAYEEEDDFLDEDGGGEAKGEEVFSSPDDEMDNSGDDTKGAIPDLWYVKNAGWNPKEKNAKNTTMWGKYNSYIRRLIHIHCDFKMDAGKNVAGIATIMRSVQTHPSFSKLGGANCHKDCPKELAAYTRNLCLEGGLHSTILERLRNYRRATKLKGALLQKRKARRIEKTFEKAKKRDGKSKMSDKDKKYMASFKEEKDKTERAKELKRDRSADKIYQAQRRVQIDKVNSRLAQPYVCV
jgi:hypothetical protein